MRKDFDLAVELYEAGLSIGAVSNYYGMTRQAMHKILQRRGVMFRPRVRFGAANHFHRGGSKIDKRAHDLLELAVEKGILKRASSCEICGAGPVPMKDGRTAIQAHHDDYNKPLSVRWLCQGCHHKWHAAHRAIPFRQEP